MHDDLLKEGPREAPEPETAEQKSRKLGLKTAGGGVAAGGFALAKIGFLGKFLIWFFAWRGVVDAWRLGGSVEVPTPEGAVSLKIPAGSEDGKLIRIKGRGAPKLAGSGKGDVLARVRIEVPKRVNKKERELLEELKKANG